MSRFVYKLYHKGKLIGDFTSINHILTKNEFLEEVKDNILETFKLPSFTKRNSQIFEDEKHKIKIESLYIEITGQIQLCIEGN